MARRVPRPAPALRPCTPASWLPAGVRVEGELHGGACRLVVLVDGEELASPLAAVARVSWEHQWIVLVALAWSRHRLAVASRQAVEREAESYAKAERVEILRRDGER